MDKKEAGDRQEICVIYSTVPTTRSKDLAGQLLDKHLVACVNILPVRSLYWWRGEQCDDREHLLIIKTRKCFVARVIRALKAIHPYEVPEIIVLPVIAGHAPYMEWVYEQTQGP